MERPKVIKLKPLLGKVKSWFNRKSTIIKHKLLQSNLNKNKHHQQKIIPHRPKQLHLKLLHNHYRLKICSNPSVKPFKLKQIICNKSWANILIKNSKSHHHLKVIKCSILFSLGFSRLPIGYNKWTVLHSILPKLVNQRTQTHSNNNLVHLVGLLKHRQTLTQIRR